MPPSRKADAQTAHAMRRCHDRYGIYISEEGLRDLVRSIQAGRCKHVKSQSHRISVFDCPINVSKSYRGLLNYREIIDVRVVYDKERKTIVTFLTEGMGE